jgi:hypothetical protein
MSRKPREATAILTTKAIESAMATRGVGREELSKATGLDRRTLSHVIRGHNKSGRALARLEFFLGISFRNDEPGLCQRQFLAKIFGGDVAVMGISDIQRRAVGLNISGCRGKTKADLVRHVHDTLQNIVKLSQGETGGKTKIETAPIERGESENDNGADAGKVKRQ